MKKSWQINNEGDGRDLFLQISGPVVRGLRSPESRKNISLTSLLVLLVVETEARTKKGRNVFMGLTGVVVEVKGMKLENKYKKPLHKNVRRHAENYN